MKLGIGRVLKKGQLVSLAVTSALAIAALVVGTNFQNIISPFGPQNNTLADGGALNISGRISDNFSNGVINSDRWRKELSQGARIVEGESKVLRMVVDEGPFENRARSGILYSKQVIESQKNFVAVATILKPEVTGEGVGTAALRFSTPSQIQDESAVIRWEVKSDNSSRLVFSVRAPNNDLIEKQIVPLTLDDKTVALRLVRFNNKYRAYYKLGKYNNGNTNWILIGKEEDDVLVGEPGIISFSASNTGLQSKYPKVVSRVDDMHFGWETDQENNRASYYDWFNNDAIATIWKVTTRGSRVTETPSDNLVISVNEGMTENKSNLGYIIFDKVIGNQKDFSASVQVFKPKVIGDGTGTSDVRYVSSSGNDDESMNVRWLVKGNVSRLDFRVRAPNGDLIKNSSKSLPETVNKVTLHLQRTNNRYSASYKVGSNDPDVRFISIGSVNNQALAAQEGRIGIYVSNVGAEQKYPKVIGRFDSFSINWDK